MEDEDILRLNEDLLAYLGYTWDDLENELVSNLNDENIQKFLLRGIDLLSDKIKNVDSFGFKDPRISILLPFWKSIFEKISVDVVYLICIRNPLSVIKSLEKRDCFSVEKGASLWLKYNTVCIINLEKEHCLFIDYDVFLDDPKKQLSRIANIIKKPFSLESVNIIEYLQNFISQDLRHNREGTEHNLSLLSSKSTEIKELFHTLQDACNHTDFDSNNISAFFQKCFPREKRVTKFRKEGKFYTNGNTSLQNIICSKF